MQSLHIDVYKVTLDSGSLSEVRAGKAEKGYYVDKRSKESRAFDKLLLGVALGKRDGSELKRERPLGLGSTPTSTSAST